MASSFYEKIQLHGLTKALFQFFGLTANGAIGFDINGKLKNIDGLGETITEGELALTDVTTANASTTKHGFLKKLSNEAAEVMTGTGAWATIATILGFTPADAANIPVKASGAEVNTGSNDTKFLTPLSIADSYLGDLATAPAAFVADPTGAVTDQDDEARAAIASILDVLIAKGLMAPTA